MLIKHVNTNQQPNRDNHQDQIDSNDKTDDNVKDQDEHWQV